MTQHKAIAHGRVAAITGGAGGIGLAVAQRLAGLGMKLALADLPGPALEAARAAFEAQGVAVIACPTDVSKAEQVQRFADAALELGEVGFVLNNAGIGAAVSGGGKPWENPQGWAMTLGVNLGGIAHGAQAFTPRLLAAPGAAIIVNTGSKQGITTPPGDAAYNVSKAGVKVLTEQMAHELRGLTDGRVSAHLLIPGHTFTGMTAKGRSEAPPSAWSAGQVADFLLEGLARGDFYILCPDNETPRAVDERRIAWAAEDLIDNRPALSRWHPDWKDAFAAFMAKG